MNKKKLFQKFTALFMSLLMLLDVGATYIQAESNETSMNNSVFAYGTDSFGNMMSDMVNEEAEKIIQNEGYNIFSVIVGGDELNDNEALVSFESLEDATIIVALYDDACEQMLLSEKINVYKDEKISIVEFDTEDMPETFYIKAYLVDEESLRPLSTVYESAVYTQEMQEFLNKTVDDFEEDRVLNFDDSVDNNFAIYKENVEVIDGDNSTSKLVSVDEENRKYVFNNADSEITSLKEGDIFAYENEDGTIVIINVSSIVIDGTMVTVYGQETTMEEVFDYVKIDTAMGTSEAVIDDSNLGEGITNNGYVEYDEPQTYAIISEAKVGGGVELNIFEYELGDEKNKVEVTGDVVFGVEASLKFYLTFNYYYVELKLDYSAKIEVEVTGQISGEIEMPSFCFSPVPGLYIEFTPAVVVEVSVEIKVEGKLEGTIGTQNSSDGTSKSLNSTPKFDGSVEVEGKFFIGISLKPRVKLISDKIAKIELEAKVGAEVTVTKKWESESDTEKHTCKNCLDGDISAVAQVKFEAKFFNNDRFAVKADLLDLKIKICDFYISIDNGEFGFTTCPHISYKITVYVVDSNGKYVMHAMVNEEYSTTDVGYVEMYLPTGDYVIKAVQGKEYGERNVYVADDAREIEIYIDENGGSGKNDVNNKGEGEKEEEDDNRQDNQQKENGKLQMFFLHNNRYSCAYLSPSGELYMWGANECGQLGDGTKIDRYEPVKIMENVKQIYMDDYKCPSVITNDDEWYMWGYSDRHNQYICEPQKIMENVKYVDKCMVITNDDNLYLYKHVDAVDYDLEIAINDDWFELNSSDWKAAFVMSDVIQVAYDMVITKDNKLIDIMREGIFDISYPLNVVRVYCCCAEPVLCRTKTYAAITKEGDLYMWGENYRGQCGNGTSETYEYEPIKIMENVKSVNLNCYESGAITTSGDLYRWGYNGEGQLGDGTFKDKSIPIKIMENVKNFYNRNYGKDRAVIDREGNLYMWGNNSFEPVKIMEEVENVSFINGSVGAITTSGDIYMWGNNDCGQLGDGTTINRDRATKIDIDNTYAIPELLAMNDSANNVLTESSLATSETYNDLTPNSVYNFYILKSDSASDKLSSDNLLYITQATSDENGQLNINYIPKEYCEGAVKLLVGMNDYDISDADITISDITYTGEQQHVSVEVVYKGETLEQYVDYEISGDYVVTEVGEYNIVIEGKGKYTGKSSINFKVKKDFIIGDANNDEKIDTQDAVLLKKYLAGYSDLGINEEACDVNNDGEINSADAVILLKHLAGYDVGLAS